jgi:hypothetical protein
MRWACVLTPCCKQLVQLCLTWAAVSGELLKLCACSVTSKC